MDLARMIEALSDPAAYPRSHPADTVEVRQTHISVVFLAGPHAYKIKKPLALGFLDYSTPERRRHCCEREIRLNRRLAPSVAVSLTAPRASFAGSFRWSTISCATALASCFNQVVIPWSNDTVISNDGESAVGKVFQETGYGLSGIAGESDAHGPRAVPGRD